MPASAGQSGKPAVLWSITGEEVRVKNTILTCPNCGKREYIVSVRGVAAVSGDRRGVLVDDVHRCGACGKPYGVPVEV